jgi:hypothetical protein
MISFILKNCGFSYVLDSIKFCDEPDAGDLSISLIDSVTTL